MPSAYSRPVRSARALAIGWLCWNPAVPTSGATSPTTRWAVSGPRSLMYPGGEVGVRVTGCGEAAGRDRCQECGGDLGVGAAQCDQGVVADSGQNSDPEPCRECLGHEGVDAWYTNSIDSNTGRSHRLRSDMGHTPSATSRVRVLSAPSQPGPDRYFMVLYHQRIGVRAGGRVLVRRCGRPRAPGR